MPSYPIWFFEDNPDFDEATLELELVDDAYASRQCDEAEADAEFVRAGNSPHNAIDPAPHVPWSDANDGDDDRTPPPAAGCVALPRQLSDDTLVCLISQADRGDPRGHLRELGIRRSALPDFAAACAAELVARLDGRAAASQAA